MTTDLGSKIVKSQARKNLLKSISDLWLSFKTDEIVKL